MKRISVFVLTILCITFLLTTCAFADEVKITGIAAKSEATVSMWRNGEFVDEFGDSIEGSSYVVNINHFDGTFDNSATTKSPLWTDILFYKNGFNFTFYPYKKTSSPYRNNSSFNDKSYEVLVKDESNELHSYYGFILMSDYYMHIVDSKKVYNRLNDTSEIKEGDYDEFMALFMKNQILKFSINADSGADSFSFQVDTTGFAQAYGATISPLKEYTDKEIVKNVQAAMNELGYECGTPDGAAGKKTKAAISAFQTDKNLTVTGTITHEMLEALRALGIDI